MVSVQLLVLFIMQSKDFNYNNLLYILLVLILYFPTQIIYKKIDQLKVHDLAFLSSGQSYMVLRRDR